MRENGAFEYDFFQLPDLNPSALTHSIEARLLAESAEVVRGRVNFARPCLF